MTVGWIPEDNLALFLRLVSKFTDYSWTDGDWDAVRFGIRDTDEKHQIWYDYPLMGTPPVHLDFACASAPPRLVVRWETHENIAARIEALSLILQHYHAQDGTDEFERLIETAFGEVAYPHGNSPLACDPAHLAVCPECQEAQQIYREQHWTELVGDKQRPPCGYADLYLLTPEARRFFFPAYLTATWRYKNTAWLDHAIHAGISTSGFTMLQRELVEFVVHIVEEEEVPI
jgi:hypothetical protein